MTALHKDWTASEIIARAEAKGVTITAEGEKIKLVPSSAVTIQMRRVVLEYKPILLAHFAALPAASSSSDNEAPDLYQGMSYDEWLASLVLDPPLCLTCLDGGQEREALPEDYEGFMYCQAHHHQSQRKKGYQVLTSPSEINAFVLLPGRYVLDLETTGLSPEQQKIISIAFGRPGSVCIIDVRAYYSALEPERNAWREALQSLLQLDDVVWIGHNIKFDWRFLAHHFGVQLPRVEDTMLIEKLLHNGESSISASMQASAARYGLAVSKEERSWFIDLDKRASEWGAPLPDEQLAYMVQDIEIPWQIRELQTSLAEEKGLDQVVKLEHAALPAIAAMEDHGILIDVASWRAILSEKRAHHIELEEKIQTILAEGASAQVQQPTLFGESVSASKPINLASHEQLRKALARVEVYTGTTLEELEDARDEHEIVPLLLEWKALEKLLTTYGESFLSKVSADGRIHAEFAQLGAESGRIICRSPNIQQVPRPEEGADLRACFVATPGHKMLIADLSNIELRILAEMSQDRMMLRFFAEGKDLHAETAKLMFRLPADTDTKKHRVNGLKVRDIAKTINFGLAYGMGAQGLANRIGVELEDAKKLMGMYFETYQGVKRYLQRSGREAMSRGYAVSLSGRRRSFPPVEREENSALYGKYERAAKTDTGGNALQFKQINNAYQHVMQWLDEEEEDEEAQEV